MNPEISRTTSIGHIASQVLRRNSSYLVSGASSLGIYLQPQSDLTLYLTMEPYRGPLTINIRGERNSLFAIQTGELAEYDGGQINFLDANFGIQVQSPLIWKPPQIPLTNQTSPTAPDTITSQVIEVVPDHSYLPLLKTIKSGEPLPLQDLPDFSKRVLQLSKSLKTGNHSEILSEMKLILGLGPGLTPLGDDLLLGVLLAINRAKKQMVWTGDLIHFYHTIISAAEEKTTRISWSLLSCAIQGSADERITLVLDGLISGREIPNRDLENLLAWGSSSGMAVLAGILMGLA